MKASYRLRKIIGETKVTRAAVEEIALSPRHRDMVDADQREFFRSHRGLPATHLSVAAWTAEEEEAIAHMATEAELDRRAVQAQMYAAQGKDGHYHAGVHAEDDTQIEMQHRM